METLMLPFSPRFVVLTIWRRLTALLIGLGIVDRKVSIWSDPDPDLRGLTALGIRDLLQQITRCCETYPISAHLRFLLEEDPPEMRQYFFPRARRTACPFSRDTRRHLSARQMVLDKRPFGTQEDV